MSEQVENAIKEIEEGFRQVAQDTVYDMIANIVKHADVPLGSAYWYDLSIFIYSKDTLRQPFMHPDEKRLLGL